MVSFFWANGKNAEFRFVRFAFLAFESKVVFPFVLHLASALHRGISETYVFCFYWTLGVMRTMPAEVTPVNLPERVFVLIFMFFALSAFAISIALITQSFFKLSERRKTFNEEYVALRLHLQKTKVSEDVQGRVKAYLTHLFTRRRIQVTN